ncbi:hypothetical protein BGZ76_007502 [Entomortierella beljakovae]|nr:hypothetical protein BGZ76_007502 [Entomortierella beljakovae]
MASSTKGTLVQAGTEFLGTAIYMYLAIGGANAVGMGLPAGAAALAQSFAFGFGMVGCTWVFHRISGAMLNPAVAFSSMITGHLTFVKFVAYFIAEILGAMLGVAMVRGTTPSSEDINQVNAIAHGESMARAFFLEFFLTATVCFIYHIVAHERSRTSFIVGLPYGLALFSCHLFATRYDNAAINPARAFAVSIVYRWFPDDHWIYWFGPLTGAFFAAALHILFRVADFDRYTAGIDAENEVAYYKTRKAINGEDIPHGRSD